MSEPVKTRLDVRLESLRDSIVHGYDEEAQNHLFALLRGLRCKDLPDDQLTRYARSLKREWEASGE